MGYWGWRQVCSVFVSVWVVGCSITHDAAPTISPTRPPFVALTERFPTTSPPTPTPVPPDDTPSPAPTAIVYTIQKGDTLLAISVQFGVSLEALQNANPPLDPIRLPIGQTIIIPNPKFNDQGLPVLPTATPVALFLPVPSCYPVPTGEILCLGQVVNNRSEAIQRILLHVRLYNREGGTMAEGDTSIEQETIPAGTSAPYRLLLPGSWQQYSGSTVWLKSADMVQNAVMHWAALDIQEQPIQMIDGQYVLFVSVRNPNAETAHLLRAIATLLDADGQITGYRVMPLSSMLSAGGEFNFQISIMPQTGTTAAHTLYIEAEPHS